MRDDFMPDWVVRQFIVDLRKTPIMGAMSEEAYEIVFRTVESWAYGLWCALFRVCLTLCIWWILLQIAKWWYGEDEFRERMGW
jgi:spore maturation protein CgeB